MTTTDTTREEKIKKIYEVIGGYYYETEYGGYTEDVVICMLGDVLQRIRNKDLTDQHWSMYWKDYFNETVNCRDKNKLNKPIEDQSDECVDFIYSLISQGQTQTK